MISRPARREDLAAVVDLFCRYEQLHRGAPDTDDSDITQDWDLPDWDFAASTLVVEDTGRLLGYAVVSDEYADTVVDPDLDDPDLHERLLDWVEDRTQALESHVPDTDPVLSARLERRGWLPARRVWRMRRVLTAPLPAPQWPAGVAVRAYDRPGDDVAVHALVTSAFAEIGGQAERSLEQWRQWMVLSEKFDAELYLVAVEDDRIVGVALGQQLGELGMVRQLAVDPALRGRGLGLALLHESFRRHAARGLPETILGVDAANPTGAIALYEKAGMSVYEQFTRWDRPQRS